MSEDPSVSDRAATGSGGTEGDGTEARERQQLSALGQPANDPTDTDTGVPDIAGEHEDTAVDKRIITGADTDREAESPRGWCGMDPPTV